MYQKLVTFLSAPCLTLRFASGITVKIHRIHPRELPPDQDALAVALAGGTDLDFKVLEEIC